MTDTIYLNLKYSLIVESNSDLPLRLKSVERMFCAILMTRTLASLDGVSLESQIGDDAAASFYNKTCVVVRKSR